MAEPQARAQRGAGHARVRYLRASLAAPGRAQHRRARGGFRADAEAAAEWDSGAAEGVPVEVRGGELTRPCSARSARPPRSARRSNAHAWPQHRVNLNLFSAA